MISLKHHDIRMECENKMSNQILKEINQMTSREAMGLQKTYASSVLEYANQHFKNVINDSSNCFIDILSSCEATFQERWIAGVVLALIGDPRIDPVNPIMITIPTSSVMIGSSEDETNLTYEKYANIGVKKKWLIKECPMHSIMISKFNIAKFLVTNYEYLIFLKDTNHADIPNSWRFGIYDQSKSNHPVYGIKPESADLYAKWLSKKLNRKFRLPSEYEWEYAAAGIKRNEFPWGNSFSTDVTNTLESGIYSTTPVGMYPAGASPFGCLDMAGNVEEFVSNNYFPYPNGQIINDDLGGLGDYRIARGGSFTRYSDLARCRRRHGFLNREVYAIGFRLAEDCI